MTDTCGKATGAPVLRPPGPGLELQASFCALGKPSGQGGGERGAVVHDDLTRDRSVYGSAV